MSCYVCSDLHVTVVAQWAHLNLGMNYVRWDSETTTPDLKRMFAILNHANRMSVAERYSEPLAEPGELVDTNAWTLFYTPPQILKLAECLSYQSGDWRDLRNSRAAEILGGVISRLAGFSGTPEYAAAHFSINDKSESTA